MARVLILLMLFVCMVRVKELNVLTFGAVPNDKSATLTNQQAISHTLSNATQGDVVIIPIGKFYCLGGIVGSNLHEVTVVVNGELIADPDFKNWPVDVKHNSYVPFVSITDSTGVHIYGGGVVRGEGLDWWNKVVFPDIYGPLKHSRAKLVYLGNVTDSSVKDMVLIDSPSWHLDLLDVARIEISQVTITVNRSQVNDLKRAMKEKRVPMSTGKENYFSGLEPEDLNTDGIDIRGIDVWVHDCYIQNDDDSIAVKPCNRGCIHSDCTRNILIENTVLTGFGASIGSVPPSPLINCVKNTTFRNIRMPYTGKGIYVKSNPECDGTNSGIIQDIFYENIDILYPRWWAIWIGPQQQHQPGKDIGRKCSLSYPIFSYCPTQGCVDFRNIVLTNVTIDSPWMSPGVILGNSTNPMQDIIFRNVTVTNPGHFPYGNKYKCEHAHGISQNSDPVPHCLSN